MTAVSTTAERMAMLPADVPRDAVIVVRNMKREYQMGAEVVRALRGVKCGVRAYSVGQERHVSAAGGRSDAGRSTATPCLVY